MIRLRAFLIVLATQLLFAAPAVAHVMLERAEPEVGARGAPPPAQILVVFSEAIEPMLSEIALTREDGAPIALGKPYADGSKRRLGAAVEGALSLGRFHLIWRVVSADGHRSEGDFSFTVAAAESTL